MYGTAVLVVFDSDEEHMELCEDACFLKTFESNGFVPVMGVSTICLFHLVGLSVVWGDVWCNG